MLEGVTNLYLFAVYSLILALANLLADRADRPNARPKAPREGKRLGGGP